MEQISEDEFLHLAHLCRISISKKKMKEILVEFQAVVKYVELLNEVDTSGVEPCNYVAQSHSKTPLRDDEPENSLDKDVFLKGTPKTIASLVQVPTVLRS